MKTAKQTIFIWGKTTEDEVISKIKKAIQDFQKIGLDIQTIELEFQDKEDGDIKTMEKEVSQ
jgi:hypothetical protein